MQSPYDVFDLQFLAFLDRGALRIPRDSKNGRFLGLHARSWRVSRESTVDWVPAAGTGVVVSFTVFHRQFEQGFPAPYTVAMVELDEGPRLVARLLDPAPRAGMAVTADFDVKGLVFKPSPP
ncbi:OB-fold domain-containing protein [Variovorax paradoxus]|uniref:Zn-ribbon domain-containing OB-fold protein n=1 Tax=Variovorax paradoxus TaxID=34073 RepID=UPI001ABCAC32